MAAPALLFDVEPFSDRKAAKPAGKRIRADVRAALMRLKSTIDAIPPEEWKRREQRWEELMKSIHGAR
ncbi:MAG: hypothetical protein AMXMBFR84_23440 [Candidatus Hydrogenedentota bacterium]